MKVVNNFSTCNRNEGVSLHSVKPLFPVENNTLTSNGKFVKHYIIGNFKNPLVSREQLNKNDF